MRSAIRSLFTRPTFRSFNRPANLRLSRRQLSLTSLEDRCTPASFVVTNLLDAGAGSLREAIAQADTNPGLDTITFTVTGTILLASTLSVQSDVNINGPAGLVTLDGNNANQVMNMFSPATAVNISNMVFTKGKSIGLAGGAIAPAPGINLALTLTNVTVSNSLSDVGGGGIAMDSGSLTLVGCTISGNTALGSVAGNIYGGGIYLTGATTLLSISNSLISGNLVRGVGNVGYGAGIAIKGPTGSFTIAGTNFYKNTGDGGSGGAIFNQSAELTFSNCIFKKNTAINTSVGGAIAHNAAKALTFIDSELTGNNGAGAGGTIYIGGTGAALSMTRCTVSGSNAGSAGGAIFHGTTTGVTDNFIDSTFNGNNSNNAGGVFSSSGDGTGAIINFTNCTIFGNTTTGRGGFFRTFGNFNATINVTSCTVTGNNSGGTNVGGGFALGGLAGAKVNVVNSIIAGNKVGTNPNSGTADIGFTAPIVGTDISVDFSTVGVAVAGAFSTPTAGSNKTGTTTTPLNPQLRPFTNYGGTTFTLAPLPASPGVNFGTASPLANDQRGAPFIRAFAGAVDMGAVENNVPLPWVSNVTASSVTTVGATSYQFTITFEDTNAIDDATLAAPNAVQVISDDFGASFSQFATFVKVDTAGPGTPRTATYKITPPGGSWDAGDNGSYTIRVAGGKIFDTDGPPNSVPADEYGLFTVGVPTTFVVNSTNDEAVDTDGMVSFREAVLKANASPGADTVSFDPFVFMNFETITYAKGAINITESVTITGPTAGVKLDALKASHLLNIDGAGVMEVSVSNMTFVNGFRDTNAIGANGGAIFISNENVTISNCTFDTNFNQIDGGAIGQAGAGNLTISKSTFINNVTKAASGFSGGAIYHGSSGILTISDSTFTTNKGDSVGGAVRATGTTTVNITNSTFTGNESNGTGVIGGGALALSGVTTLTISGSSFSGNLQTVSGDGGAISLFAGTTAVTISNTSFTNNSTLAGNGGAIVTRNDFAGTMVINNCTFTGNKADGAGNGGAIRAGGNATITFNNSTMSGNMAVTGSGGAIAMTLGGSLTVNASTLSGNIAGVNGGAIYAKGGVGETLLVSNSTLSGNVANNDGGGISISSFTTNTATIRNSTLTLNESTAGFIGGGGIAIQGTTGTVTISSSIIAQNLNGGDVKDVGADAITIVSGKNNVIGVGDTGNITYDPANQLGTLAVPLDAKLAPLALNGAAAGSPLTHAITNLSPAFNMGNDDAKLGTDQRGVGFNRVSGGAADAGAFEIQFAVPPTVVSVFTNGQATGQHSIVTSIVITFSEVVTIANPSLAFIINRTAGATGGDTPATGIVGYTVSGLDGMNKGSSVTITFNGTGAVGIDPGNSLRDGKYQVTIVAAQVAGSGGQLDGNANGKYDPLDPNMDNNVSNTWRLFGDGNGDGAVTAADFNDFRLFYGSVGNPLAAKYDFDASGSITASDFNNFRTRYGLSGYNIP